MEITDEFYSVLNDDEVQNRIGSLGKDNQTSGDNHNAINLLREFPAWKQENNSL